MQLPDFPPISGETLEAIGGRRDLRAGEISRLNDAGIFNTIYLVKGEYMRLLQGLCSLLVCVGHEPLHLDPDAGWC